MRKSWFDFLGAAVTSATSRSGDYPCVIRHPAAGAVRGRGDTFSSPSTGASDREQPTIKVSAASVGILSLLFALLLTSLPALGQTPKPNVERSSAGEPSVEQIRPDEPIDLPLEMLLRLNDTARSVFTKKPLQQPEPLALAVLDTLNPQGKEGEITIPLRGYPEPDQPPTKNRPIYAEGSIGLNTTAMLRAGISGNTWPFDYHASVEYGSSSGWVDNSKSSRFSVQLGGGYVIGLGYGIFSGGHMGGEAEYRAQSYRLYALPTLPERGQVDWSLKGTGTASLAGFDIEGIGHLRRLTMEQSLPVIDGIQPTPPDDTQNLDETSVEGKLRAKTSALGLGWEGLLDLRLTNTSLGSVNYGSLDVNALFETPIFAIRAGGALSMGGATDGNSLSRIAPRVELRFFPFDGL
ncbi:MAG: hypothetical protein AB7H80_14690, partial [Candidatus Kapaibacterium sp.]